jgi:uncharacterized protein (UPF0332 family)
VEAWQQWREMARESSQAAHTAENESLWRSSISRYYYAAFQAVSAVLHYRGLIPPTGEEAWGHTTTPEMLAEHFTPYIRSREARKRLGRQLEELYKLRIMADYRGSEKLDDRIGEARKYSDRLVKVVEEILPKE